MDRMQLLLWMGNQTYSDWKSTRFSTLRSVIDDADQIMTELGLPDVYRLRTSFRRGEEPVPDDYVRVALYLPLLSEPDFRRFRQTILQHQTHNADLIRSRIDFSVNVMDVPEALSWHRFRLVLEASFRWRDERQRHDVYQNLSAPAASYGILQETVSIVCLPQHRLLKEHLGGSVRMPCNSLFLLNLFLYTRDSSVFEEWGIHNETTVETLHNQLTSLARTRSWSRVFRAVLDSDPSIPSPFQILKEG